MENTPESIKQLSAEDFEMQNFEGQPIAVFKQGLPTNGLEINIGALRDAVIQIGTTTTIIGKYALTFLPYGSSASLIRVEVGGILTRKPLRFVIPEKDNSKTIVLHAASNQIEANRGDDGTPGKREIIYPILDQCAAC
jgi:hypothetical protein